MKPVVHYRKDTLEEFPRVGEFAFFIPIDHWDNLHVSNRRVVKTSRVVDCNWRTGEIETQNTKYIPEEC